MARQRSGLRPPLPHDAAAVPTVSRRRPLWRACAKDHAQPWWFSCRDANPAAGRFDLSGDRGTAYWAMTPAAAIIEATADPDQLEPPVLSVEAFGNVIVWQAEHVPAARTKKLADTTVASVPRLTGELSTIVPYHLCWEWADAFDAAGCSGILYRSRFGLDESIALFGPAGEPVRPPAAVPTRAVRYYLDLPPAFRQGISSIGRLDQFEQAPPP